jgi:acetylornithine deacetylase/succinyl-diaminopimelate desuccinylase-like protein
MNDIYTHIEKHLDASIERLFELVRQPSVSAQGLGFDKAPQLVKRTLESVGLAAEVVPVPNNGHPSVYGWARAGTPSHRTSTAGVKRRVATRTPAPKPSLSQGEGALDPSAPTLLFYTHYDVQPPEPLELWQTPPFEPTRRGDRVYGRGISDDKGNIAARLAAIQAFMEVRGGLPCNLKFFVEGEEESGSVNLPALIAQRGEDFKADACIWEGGGRNLSGDPFMYLGLKGVLTVRFNVRKLSGDAHSSYGTILPSAPWRLVHALATLRDATGRVLIPGFYDTVRGATRAEDEAIAKLPDETEEWKRTFGTDELLGGLEGLPLRRRHLFEPTATINGFISGYNGPGMKTVLPAEATARMDFRLVPDMRPDDIFRKLRGHLDRQGFTDIETEMMAGVNPARTPIDSPWVRLVAATAEEIYGRKPVIAPTMAGTGPMFDFGVTLGMPIATSGVDHPSHKIHAPNENITVEDFLLGAKHAALIIQRFAEQWPVASASNTGAAAKAAAAGAKKRPRLRSSMPGELGSAY